MSLDDPNFLSPTGCAALRRAEKNLGLLAGGSLTRERFVVLLPHLVDGPPNSPDLDMALNNLERLASAAISRAFLFSLLAEN